MKKPIAVHELRVVFYANCDNDAILEEIAVRVENEILRYAKATASDVASHLGYEITTEVFDGFSRLQG